MRRYVTAAFASALLALPAFAQDARPKLTDDQVAKALIKQSIDEYDGACPCPYNTMRNGRRCGGNSAYSRPGGESPLCFRKDVTDEMIAAYRKANE